ncbi:MAG: lipoprotein signal peptidase [Sulfurospirillum sp.]|nr:lipoprotein signal peptidase [Sulfurospirillum sp.]MBL0702693.1 lipoprotein signal peptidase [Sulfurospirillum sp.]
MFKSLIIFICVFIAIFVIDQNLKTIFLDGFRWYGDYFSLILTYNKGVAFSMLSFLDTSLKYFQLALILGIVLYLILKKDVFKDYFIPAGALLGAGCSNLYDRFIHGGVVDYFYWHKWFNFAVFNFADVMINFSVILILFLSYRK